MNALMDPIGYPGDEKDKNDILAFLSIYLIRENENEEDYLEYLIYTNSIFSTDPFEPIQNFKIDNVTGFISDFYMEYTEMTPEDKKYNLDKWNIVKDLITNMDEEKLLEMGYRMCSIRIMSLLTSYLEVISEPFAT